ncbi:glycoside hydrolase [Trametes cingulata]|nr:glycoside hydrolase [Trametes cingulata]
MATFTGWQCKLLLVSLLILPALSLNLPPLVPAVHQSFLDAGRGSFKLPKHVEIVVDERDAHSTKDNGLTLIPPTLLNFSQTFKSDLEILFPQTRVSLSVGDARRSIHSPSAISLSLSGTLNLTHADGTPTTEGYELEVSPTNIRITGAGSKGAFWATRTLLQGLVLNAASFRPGRSWTSLTGVPAGSCSVGRCQVYASHAGRQWYPIGFLQDLCTYASWFKISEFHVHLSDNVAPQNGDHNVYARFRLRPEDPALAGLTPYLNETYLREEFDAFQAGCAARGVTVVPEIESPGHALVITRWKPELALSTDPTLINLTVPDAIPTVKSIWKEFLPWFHTKEVSIGADEYNATLADDYNNFVNEMSDFITQESGKTIRLWGTREPSNRTSVSKNITVQHWDFMDDDPSELIRSGYNVINSEDAFLYLVMKLGFFPQSLNQTRLWEGANAQTGGIWDPHVFDQANSTNNPNITDPRLKGAIMAAWNDPGPTASTFLEAFYALKEGIPVVASAAWQAASRPNHLTHAQFLAAFPHLEAAAPGQNLDRRIPSKGEVVVDYDLSHFGAAASGEVQDRSGNGYDARLENGVLRTRLGSKGHNYTLLLRATISGAPTVLLDGPDNSFGLQASPDGGLTLAFTSSNITYPLSNFTLASKPTGTAHEIVLTGTENGTSAFVDGIHAGHFLVAIKPGAFLGSDRQTDVIVPMAFVAPVHTVGGKGVKVEKFVVWNGIQNSTIIGSA